MLDPEAAGSVAVLIMSFRTETQMTIGLAVAPGAFEVSQSPAWEQFQTGLRRCLAGLQVAAPPSSRAPALFPSATHRSLHSSAHRRCLQSGVDADNLDVQFLESLRRRLQVTAGALRLRLRCLVGSSVPIAEDVMSSPSFSSSLATQINAAGSAMPPLSAASLNVTIDSVSTDISYSVRSRLEGEALAGLVAELQDASALQESISSTVGRAIPVRSGSAAAETAGLPAVFDIPDQTPESPMSPAFVIIVSRGHGLSSRFGRADMLPRLRCRRSYCWHASPPSSCLAAFVGAFDNGSGRGKSSTWEV